MLLFFFFQAEDGIRDYKVTGVQTCALPIAQPAPRSGDAAPWHDPSPRPLRLARREALSALGAPRSRRDARSGPWARPGAGPPTPPTHRRPPRKTTPPRPPRPPAAPTPPRR